MGARCFDDSKSMIKLVYSEGLLIDSENEGNQWTPTGKLSPLAVFLTDDSERFARAFPLNDRSPWKIEEPDRFELGI